MSSSGASRGSVSVQAATVAGGFALQNATPNVLTFTTPNDGKLHAYTLASFINITVIEVGGQVQLKYTIGGLLQTLVIHAAAQGVGTNQQQQSFDADPNTAVTLLQSTALTSGAASVFSTITGA